VDLWSAKGDNAALMSRYTEKPMARAHEHLASARYAEAAGAFRAVLRIDPNELRAHFGLADALVARGQRAEAVEGLVAAAESCTAREDHGAALTLYGKALAVDPSRLELHLDVAMAEAALGRMESAQQRLDHLAEVYMQAGRTDEAAEVYRCLAGWEAEGDEEELAPAPAPARTTEVPTGPGQPASHAAVPLMVPTTETVVIPTILVTPDGQLLQVPLQAQPGQPLPVDSSDSMPSLSAELLEAVHSAPLDLAEGEQIVDVERTVVGFPPPPPSLPENYESAAHPVNRAELEAAVVAAMDNLAQLEEEDMTLVMQRLPPQPKSGRVRSSTGESRLPEFVTRGRMPKPQLPPPEPDVVAELEPDDDLVADDLGAHAPREPVVETPAPPPESKLRIRPAPRPAGKPGTPSSASKPEASAPSRPSAPATPPGASQPAASPRSPAAASRPLGPASKAGVASKPAAASKPAVAPASRLGVASPPAPASRPAAPGAKPVTGKPPASGPATRPGPAAAVGGAPAAKPTRPDNPLAERLRRRAGLPRPAAPPGRPSATPTRATEPITVRSPSGLPPITKPPTTKK
jgi:hypothetical protein